MLSSDAVTFIYGVFITFPGIFLCVKQWQAAQNFDFIDPQYHNEHFGFRKYV
jgi:hypothetical protein